jgi:hypothetical protein
MNKPRGDLLCHGRTTSGGRLDVYCEATALISRLLYDLDHNQGRKAEEFFTPEGVYHPAGHDPLHGIDAIKRYFRERGVRLARHVVSNVVVLSQSPHAAEVASIMTVYGAGERGAFPANVLALLDVQDSLRRSDGQWRFSHRRMQLAPLG